MSYENIQVASSEGVVTVTVDRPEKLNALNGKTIEELLEAFATIGRDPAARVVILTGAGQKAFVAGADIGELANLTAVEAERLATRGQELMNRIEKLGKPVIAAIGGFALGGGCELALACTFRYASDGAKLGLPETGLGLIPGFGGTQRLPRLVGRGRALEMILTGDMIDAAEARSFGLVNRVYPADELMVAARKTAAKLAAKSSLTARFALQAVGEGLLLDQDGGCRLEAALFGICGSSYDAHEGCAAFLAKRAPEFRDS